MSTSTRVILQTTEFRINTNSHDTHSSATNRNRGNIGDLISEIHELTIHSEVRGFNNSESNHDDLVQCRNTMEGVGTSWPQKTYLYDDVVFIVQKTDT